MKNLKTKVNYKFENQEDFPILDANFKFKPKKKTKEKKIIEYNKKNKRNKRVIDASTKLF